MITSNRTIRWIENLADQESDVRRADRHFVDLGVPEDGLIESETAAFVRDLKKHFEYLVELFNSRVSESSLRIIFSETGGHPPVLKLSRHSMQLRVWTPKIGCVQIHCDKLLSEPNSPNRTSLMMTGTIEAEFGSFRDLEWRYLDSPVNVEQIARHYLSEFIQLSRISPKSGS